MSQVDGIAGSTGHEGNYNAGYIEIQISSGVSGMRMTFGFPPRYEEYNHEESILFGIFSEIITGKA
ncbi:MAG: hypothetical protein WAW07_05455 [Bacteroidales bacterium]